MYRIYSRYFVQPSDYCDVINNFIMSSEAPSSPPRKKQKLCQQNIQCFFKRPQATSENMPSNLADQSLTSTSSICAPDILLCTSTSEVVQSSDQPPGESTSVTTTTETSSTTPISETTTSSTSGDKW